MGRILLRLRSTISASNRVASLIFPFHTAAWHASADSVRSLLNAGNKSEKDNFTTLWRDSTQAQLTIVAITAALVSSVIASAFTWNSLQGNCWLSDAIWYSGLLMALTSIAAATQQAVALYRLTILPNGLEKIREMLSQDDVDYTGILQPRYSQLYIWQLPLMLLNGGLYLFIVGLAILLWNASKARQYQWTAEETKIATVFTIALGVAVSNYVISTAGIYNRFREIL